MSTTIACTPRVHLFDHKPGTTDQKTELMKGLSRKPRSIHPKFFYDAHGSALFDRITRQPEYYPTRTERSILRSAAEEIAECLGPGSILIEPGSGSSEKVELLLGAADLAGYVPMDISVEHLCQAAERLTRQWPELPIYAISGDYSDGFELPPQLPEARKVAFYPGSTLGNFEPTQAQYFLSQLRQLVGDDGGLLIGIDRDKDPAILNAAYNDAAGITAAFNRNILKHANRLLDADFDPERFEHLAFFNPDLSRIEMHLISCTEQTVRTDTEHLHFGCGEHIHTENSYKYSPDSFLQLAHAAGFELRQQWTDCNAWFAVYYLDTR